MEDTPLFPLIFNSLSCNCHSSVVANLFILPPLFASWYNLYAFLIKIFKCDNTGGKNSFVKSFSIYQRAPFSSCCMFLPVFCSSDCTYILLDTGKQFFLLRNTSVSLFKNLTNMPWVETLAWSPTEGRRMLDFATR